MISKFKLKQQTIEGIDLSALFDQAGEIAAFAGKIGSKGFSFDVMAGTVTFSGVTDTVGANRNVVVQRGEVVTFMSGAVTVQAREEFLAMYEEQPT